MLIAGFRWIMLASLMFLLQACEQSAKHEDKPNLLVYVGITMIQPMQEIAKHIEETYQVNIKLQKGGSKNLLLSLSSSNIGDLYLPGSDSYIKTAREQGLVSDTVAVGFNQAALLFSEGNPKQLDNDPRHFSREDLRVIIGDPDSSSVGKIAKKILDKHGSYAEVRNNVLYLTPDSKDLTKALKDNSVDLVLSWYAVSFWQENKNTIDAIALDEKYGGKKKLVIGLLESSKHPEIARHFMQYAQSEAGQAIFRAYGF